MEIFENVDIKPHLNFGIGGSVKYLCEVSSEEEIKSALKQAKKLKTPHFILGGGCNLVFSNKTHNLFVIKIKGGEMAINKSKKTIDCDAGIRLFSLVEKSVENGFAGLENLIGIPGTVGGAIYGNAGAYGNSISETVESVKIFDGKKVRNISAKNCGFYYRGSVFKKKKWVIISAKFKFKKVKADLLNERMNDILKTRNAKFSADLKCPGSYFKNIPIDELPKNFVDNEEIKKMMKNLVGDKFPAGKLLEEVGAKGLVVGGIAVSDFHGNIIINLGHGTFDDLKELVRILKEKVGEKFGVKLNEEVVVIVD